MDNQAKKNNEKGSMTEEKLAEYFRKLGYYVVRGVPVDYKNQSVTDIDLWMYMKISSISNEVVIVDIKNKRNPQAFERMLWTKGLQASVKADRAIVATTENRQSVLEYGNILDIGVIGGNFLKRMEHNINIDSRISEDYLEQMLKSLTYGKLDGDWKGRFRNCKSLLSSKITYSTIIVWLEEASYFAKQSMARTQLSSLALRLLFRIISFICIGIESVSKDLIYEDNKYRFERINEGLSFGDRGFNEIKKSIENSILLVEQYTNIKNFNGNVIRANVYKEFEKLNVPILAEYFSKLDVISEMMNLATEFEQISMSIKEPTSEIGSSRMRGTLGCLLDYWGIDRVQFGMVKVDTQKSQE